MASSIPTRPRRLILRTGNIMSTHHGLARPGLPGQSSDAELLGSLREEFLRARERWEGSKSRKGEGCGRWRKVIVEEDGEKEVVTVMVPGEVGEEEEGEKEAKEEQEREAISIEAETSSEENSINGTNDRRKKGDGLKEQRGEYDVTVKLFHLATVSPAARPSYTLSAIKHVTTLLGTPTIDLCIVSFPGIYFDADDEPTVSPPPPSPPTTSSTTTTTDETNSILPPPQEILPTYTTLSTLHITGVISRLGLSEFGTHRLQSLLPHCTVRPSVVQINVRDCCVVPRQLIEYAKREGIQLLTHNDCAEVLTAEGVRGVVEEFGLIGEAGGKRWDVVPQWVVKYTAVARHRGVVENKGYIAMVNVGWS